MVCDISCLSISKRCTETTTALLYCTGRKFKMVRLEAVRTTLSKMYPMLPSVPAMKLTPVATLGVSLCFISNGLVNRPAGEKDFQTLANACSVYENGGPIRPLGLFCLHSLVADPCPRVSTRRLPDLQTTARLCNIKNGIPEVELAKLMKRTGKERQTQLMPMWGEGPLLEEPAGGSHSNKRPAGVGLSSRTKRLRLMIGDEEEDPIGDDVADVPEPAPVDGYASEDEQDPRTSGFSNKAELNNIFKRMGGEILLKVPSVQHTKQSWRVLPDHECHSLRFDAICNSKRLPDFLRCWRQVIDPVEWDKAVNRFFPDRVKCEELFPFSADGVRVRSAMQGFNQSQFWASWTDLVLKKGTESHDLTSAQIDATVEFARKKMHSEAEWLPMGKSDRMWGTSGGKGAKVYGEDLADKYGKKIGGVVVVLNPKFCKNPDLPGGKI